MEVLKESEIVETAKSIFMGKITKKRYNFEDNKRSNDRYWGKPSVKEWVETVSKEKIAENEIIRPPFEKDEIVYLSEINKYTKIERITRSTDGSIYYDTSYVVRELPEGEECLKEKTEANISLQEELIKYQQFLDTEKEEKVKAIEEKINILYLDPSYHDGSSSMTCYYKGKKYSYSNVTSSNLEEILTDYFCLGIKKEDTKIYIDTAGLGTWFYDSILSKGYDIEKLAYSQKSIK